MKANFYLTGNDEVHDRTIKALYEGCPVDKELRNVQDYEPSDVAVVFGVQKKAVPFSKFRGNVIQKQKESGKRTIVLETGYINRGDGPDNHYAAGFDGLNGRADFNNCDSPSDRWEKLGVQLKPWKRGSRIILCGQIPWDAAVDHTNHLQWLKNKILDIHEYTDREIVFRPHPKYANREILNHIDRSFICRWSTESLLDDLQDAWCVMTFNSNSGVEAAIEGVPVFVDDCGSMAFPVANRSIIYIDNPKTPEREQWAHNLAYCQWTLDEMRSGETWNHLFRSSNLISLEKKKSTSISV
jgi:hypothetical protein